MREGRKTPYGMVVLLRCIVSWMLLRTFGSLRTPKATVELVLYRMLYRMWLEMWLECISVVLHTIPSVPSTDVVGDVVGDAGSRASFFNSIISTKAVVLPVSP